MRDYYFKLKENLKDAGFKGEIKVFEPLKKYTTWGIGGTGDIVVFPKDKEDLFKIVTFSKKEGLLLTVLGNGSNVLINDKGIRGIVVITTHLDNFTINGKTILAEAGVKLPRLARVAAQNSLSGLEFASGIPATLGGAIKMNAGAHGGSISQIIKKVVTFNREGNTVTYDREKMDFSYRRSILKDVPDIVISAELELETGNREEIEKKMASFLRTRKEKQPLSQKNAGSIFKNPEGYSAGYLIEKAGLKGLQFGLAKVSEKHANFIVNLGEAKASDVLKLMKEVQRKVYTEFGITLESEIEVLGDE